MMVLATSFPGPIAVNLALLAGVKMAGVPGAAAAVTGTILPPFLTILFLAKLLMLYINHPLVSSFFTGAGCAVVVIVGGVVCSMLKIAFSGGWKDVAVVGLVSVILLALGLHPFIAVAVGAAVRLLPGRRSHDDPGRTGGGFRTDRLCAFGGGLATIPLSTMSLY